MSSVKYLSAILLLTIGLLAPASCSSSGSDDADTKISETTEAVSDISAVETSSDTIEASIEDISPESTHEVTPETALEVTPEVTPEVTEDDIIEPDIPPVQYNCDKLPQGPFELIKIEGAIASEDLAFDGKGFLVGSNNQAIFKTAASGKVQMFAPNVKTRSGMRMLPNGTLAVCDDKLGRILTFSPDGVMKVLVQGLKYPNGITVDLKGFIYVAEHDANRVLRIHSYTGEYSVLTDKIKHPNGIHFNPDYSALYIGSFGTPWIFKLSIDGDGTPGRLVKWADMTHTPGLLDGIGVDVCGNVYVCEYGDTDIWRISPDGKTSEKIIDASSSWTYLPNLQWGRGKGWDPFSIYIPDGWNIGVWRAKIGVPSMPLPFP